MKIENQKKMHELYAHYWMAMATTVRESTSNDEPLTEDMLNAALEHINMFKECAENQQIEEEPDFSVEAPPIEYYKGNA